jgi:tRNA threonylcarbamoyladenosine biosynthesis protein TsaE
MQKEVIQIKNKQEMVELAKKLADGATKGDIFGLVGTLGAGKSFFARAFINSLSNEEVDVTSPTFNLMSLYETRGGNIVYHFDLYRLDDEEDLFNIGIEDALIEGITLIEWPEIAQNFLKRKYTQVTIQIKDAEEREVTIVRIP